ncbi:MAG: hypothetical protein JXR77_11655 [Lentisphaeria bacterium]|nr:hypothetical protein [Lentisphaeria bacterium]
MALVVVMGSAAVAAVLAAHVMLLSETIARESAVAAERSRLKYVAESAADRAFWLHLVDRRLFADRTLGRLSPQRTDPEAEPWMLDGRPHSSAGMRGLVALYDAERGIDFSGGQPGEELRQNISPEDIEWRERVETFLDIAADYVDGDDQLHLRGMERDGYLAEGLGDLPRDAPMQFREEVYWLPGWRDVLQAGVRLIPPRGITFPGNRGGRRPSFFSSSPDLLRSHGNLSETELEAVLQARESWQRDAIPLDESLGADLTARIMNRFSFVESGVAAIEAAAQSSDGDVTRRFLVARLADIRRPDAYGDNARQTWALWHRQWQ